ncbi:MAG: YdeI/OmpD-associated family protein [Nonomuraea sp.]|nr:YdeI/OmpD-associated family protein [Nonomuraea sp.]
MWQPKPRHHVNGTVDGRRIRAVIEGGAFTLGPGWLRDCGGLSLGDTVAVEITPEGPQRADLDEDFAAALAASPAAGAFFDGLAQFYRRAYLRWIDGTKRRPDERARRIAEVVTLLESGTKQRPPGGVRGSQPAG